MLRDLWLSMRPVLKAMRGVVTKTGMVLRDLLLSTRPRQWTKNVFVFAGLVFAGKLFDPILLAESLLAFALFCLASGAVYLINDVADIEKDRAHPVKRNRPLASGRLRPQAAIIAAVVLIVVAVPAAFRLNRYFGGLLLTYFLLMLAYSFLLKKIVILDIMTIAAGFALRAAGGAVAIGVPISPWLLVCMVLLALFLGLAKRRHELLLLENNAGQHRGILREYSTVMLEEMISVVSASTVIAYALYTFFGPEHQVTLPYAYTQRIPYMMLTVPFVIYGIFRYLYLVYQKKSGGSPEEILLHDLPFLTNLLLWAVAVVAILYTL